MRIELTDLLCAIKKGRSSKKELSGLVAAINKHKVGGKILESLHVGLSKMSDKDIRKYVDSL